MSFISASEGPCVSPETEALVNRNIRRTKSTRSTDLASWPWPVVASLSRFRKALPPKARARVIDEVGLGGSNRRCTNG